MNIKILLSAAILAFLLPNFAASQIRPDFAPLEEDPDTSNFEVYSQKDGNLRRGTLLGIGKYILGNLEFTYDSNNNLIVVSHFGEVDDTITLSNSITTESYFGGDGTDASPLSIDDGGITLSKVQDINSGRLIGRYSSGSGSPEQISIGDNLSLSPAGILSATAASGGTTASSDTIVAAFQNSPNFSYAASYSGTDGIDITVSDGQIDFLFPSGNFINSIRIPDEGSGGFGPYYDNNGDLTLTFEWVDSDDFGPSGINSAWINAYMPVITIIDLNTGKQLSPEGSGYQIVHSEPSLDVSSVTVSGLNGIGQYMLVLNF